jgi:DNA (cytosine-5)-methyltransferase 1
MTHRLPENCLKNQYRKTLSTITDMRRRKPTFLSLFSGCGGFDLGFQHAGYECVGAFDIDENALDVYRKNIPFRASSCDLSTASFACFRGCDVLAAGPPCQGFSTIGKRILNDPRNQLFVTTAELAINIRPKVVLIENVAGAIAGKHTLYLNTSLKLLESAGYRTEVVHCSADLMGLPQLRKRILLFAWNTSFSGPITLPQFPRRSLGDAIGSIPSNLCNHIPKFLLSKSTSGMIARRIAPGQKLSNVRSSERNIHTWQIPEVFGRTNRQERSVLNALIHRRRQKRTRDFGDGDPVSAQALARYMCRPVASTLESLLAKGYIRKIDKKFEFTHTFNGKYRRLKWDLPAPTVDTKYGDPRYFLHPDEDRGFTVREAACIQGFPFDFEFLGSEMLQYRMIANAVPPPISQIIASYLLTIL